VNILNQENIEFHQFQIEVTFVWDCIVRTSLIMLINAFRRREEIKCEHAHVTCSKFLAILIDLSRQD